MPILLSKKAARILAAKTARENAAALLAVAALNNVSDNSDADHNGNLTAIELATPSVAKPAPAVSARAARAATNADAFYIGRAQAYALFSVFDNAASKPFKSAYALAKLAPINLQARGCAPKPRQAALICAMLAADLANDASARNIKPSGEFIRGAFRIPVSENVTAETGPESGCISDQIPRGTFAYVSGPLQSRETVLNLNLAQARAEICGQLGTTENTRPIIAYIDALLAPVPAPIAPVTE